MATPKKRPEDKKKTGRPSKFTSDIAHKVFEQAKLGATDKEIAKAIDVTEQTLNNWKTDHPEFFESLKRAKEIADQEVVRSLFERATGYNFASMKIMQYEGCPVIVHHVEHVPPDVTAGIFWLKNRQPDQWRDKVEHNVTTDFATRLIQARERALARKTGKAGQTRRRAA